MPHHVNIRPSASAEQLLDFTCATAWERLSLDIELVLRRWLLHDGGEPRPQSLLNSASIISTNTNANIPDNPFDTLSSPSSASSSTSTATLSSLNSPTPPPIASTTVSFGQIALSLQLFCSERTPFPHKYALERYFSVTTYVMLGPHDNESVLGDDENECMTYLSALVVAAQSCNCTLPLFVPIGRPSSLRFLGRNHHMSSFRRFICDFTHQRSHEHRHVAGLLALLGSKRFTPLPKASTTIAARFTYEWSDFPVRFPPVPDSMLTDRLFMTAHNRALSEADPVRLIRISAIWEPFSVKELDRNDEFAAMPAKTATRLRLSLPSSVNSHISCNNIRTPISACARLNVRLARKAKSRLGSANPAAPLPLLIIEPVRNRTFSASLHAVVQTYVDQVGQYVEAVAPRNDSIDGEFLTSAMKALFQVDLSGQGIMVDVVEALGGSASGLPLLERLARLIAVTDSLQSAQQLWNLFLDGVQTLWEHRLTIPALPFNPDTGPDHDASLVLQKLQMINCCTHRLRSKSQHSMHGGAFDDDDMGRKRKLDGVPLINSPIKCDGVNLQSMEENSVWEPYVQPHPLVTRDMVEDELQRMVQRAEALKRQSQNIEPANSPEQRPIEANTLVDPLSPTSMRVPPYIENEDVQAKRQSLTLKSDMMAFKAANPKAVLADFVRWFSPSDWIEDDSGMRFDGMDSMVAPPSPSLAQTDEDVMEVSSIDTFDVEKFDTKKKNGSEKSDPAVNNVDNSNGPPATTQSRKGARRRGRLSTRMSREGNIWEELWNGAESMAANLQAPLFDAAAHGSKALADLRVMPLTHVFAHMSILQGDCGVQLLLNGLRDRPHFLPYVERCVEGARQVIRRLGSKLPLIDAKAVAVNTGVSSYSEYQQQDSDLDSMFNDMVTELVRAEHTVLVATSLLGKLPVMPELAPVVNALCQAQGHADIAREEVRHKQDACFSMVVKYAGLDDAAWKSLVLPKGREFVIRAEDGDRMFAQWGGDDFRVGLSLDVGKRYGIR